MSSSSRNKKGKNKTWANVGKQNVFFLFFQKILIHLPWRVFWFGPPSSPPFLMEIPVLGFCNLPFSLEFPETLLGVGMDIFWNCTM